MFATTEREIDFGQAVALGFSHVCQLFAKIIPMALMSLKMPVSIAGPTTPYV